MTVESFFSRLIGDIGASLTCDHLRRALVQQLHDLYSAEEQLMDAIPALANGSASSDLQAALNSHLTESRLQKERLDLAFQLLGEVPWGETSKPMQALLAEGSEVLELAGPPELKDAELRRVARRVEAYALAGYGRARVFASQLGLARIAQLLEQSRDEMAQLVKLLGGQHRAQAA